MEEKYPGWMDTTVARDHLEAICCAAEEYAKQGHQTGTGLLLVIDLQTAPGAVKETFFVAQDGVASEGGHGQTLAAALLDQLVILVREGDAEWGVGGPEIEVNLQQLANSVFSYGVRKRRIFATIWICGREKVAAYIDFMPVTDHEPLANLLAWARRSLIGQEDEPAVVPQGAPEKAE